MSRKISKSKKRELRKKRNDKKIKKMESQDKRGISRKKLVDAINPKVFIILKIISIILIPICYFLYSPLLIVCVIFSILMALFAGMAENYINHTYIKSRHIKLLKIDSIIAAIVIIFSFSGFLLSFNSKKKMPFDDNSRGIIIKIENLSSCQTGKRSIIKLGGLKPRFSNVDFPGDMPKMPPEGFDFKKFNVDITDIPIEAVFSQIISNINTTLIFMIPISGIITIIHYKYKKKKFDIEMNEVVDLDLGNIDDDKLESLFMFGYIEDENKDSTDL